MRMQPLCRGMLPHIAQLSRLAALALHLPHGLARRARLAAGDDGGRAGDEGAHARQRALCVDVDICQVDVNSFLLDLTQCHSIPLIFTHFSRNFTQFYSKFRFRVKTMKTQ